MTYLSNHYEQITDVQFDWRKKNLLAKLEPYLKGKTLLDIGCGKGDLLFRAKQKGMDITGIEPDSELVNLAYRQYGLKGIENIGFEDYNDDQKFDCIVMIDVLEHIQDDYAQLKKIRKMLNKGGRLILVVPSPPWLFGQRDVAVGHYRRYSKKELITKLEGAEFRNIKARYWNMLGLFFYWLYQKVLHRDLNVYSLRTKPSLSNKLLDLWFKYIENNINLGFGMGIICVVGNE